MTRTDPDYAALTVVNRVLGGTMGRLFRHLREEKGYTYGIGSGFSATQYRGAWTASHERAHRRHRAGADAICWRRSPSCATSRCRSRSSPTPSAPSSAASRCRLENPQQVLGYYIDNWQYRLPADYWDTYPAAHHRRSPRRRRRPRRKSTGTRAAADRRGRRRDEDHRHPCKKGELRDLRRGRQSDEVARFAVRDRSRSR